MRRFVPLLLLFACVPLGADPTPRADDAAEPTAAAQGSWSTSLGDGRTLACTAPEPSPEATRPGAPCDPADATDLSRYAGPDGILLTADDTYDLGDRPTQPPG